MEKNTGCFSHVPFSSRSACSDAEQKPRLTTGCTQIPQELLLQKPRQEAKGDPVVINLLCELHLLEYSRDQKFLDDFNCLQNLISGR